MIVSCGTVIVRRVGDTYLFLLLRSWNFWDFPKGRNESGESYFETALRETEEETSLSPSELDFKWGKESYTTEPFNGFQGKKVGKYFIAETEREDIILPVSEELGKPEHSEYRWVTYKEGQKLTNHRIGAVLKWASERLKANQKPE